MALLLSRTVPRRESSVHPISKRILALHRPLDAYMYISTKCLVSKHSHRIEYCLSPRHHKVRTSFTATRLSRLRLLRLVPLTSPRSMFLRRPCCSSNIAFFSFLDTSRLFVPPFLWPIVSMIYLRSSVIMTYLKLLLRLNVLQVPLLHSFFDNVFLELLLFHNLGHAQTKELIDRRRLMPDRLRDWSAIGGLRRRRPVLMLCWTDRVGAQLHIGDATLLRYTLASRSYGGLLRRSLSFDVRDGLPHGKMRCTRSP